MLRTIRSVATIAVALLLGGCYDIEASRAPPVVVTVRVAPEDAASVPAMERALTTRLGQFRASALSSLSSEVHGNVIRFRFEKTVLERRFIAMQLDTRGELRVNGAGRKWELWFTDADVRSAQAHEAQQDDLGWIVDIELTPEAGRRVAMLSDRHTNEDVEWHWDDRLLMKSTIRGKLGTSFQVTMPDATQAQLLANVLTNGRLPARILDYDIDMSPAAD